MLTAASRDEIDQGYGPSVVSVFGWSSNMHYSLGNLMSYSWEKFQT